MAIVEVILSATGVELDNLVLQLVRSNFLELSNIILFHLICMTSAAKVVAAETPCDAMDPWCIANGSDLHVWLLLAASLDKAQTGRL